VGCAANNVVWIILPTMSSNLILAY